MHSSTLLSLATALFTMTASAAPLLSRSTESTCSPVINGNYSTHIATAFNTRSAWKYVGSGEGSNGDYPVNTQVVSFHSLRLVVSSSMLTPKSCIVDDSRRLMSARWTRTLLELTPPFLNGTAQTTNTELGESLTILFLCHFELTLRSPLSLTAL